MSARIEHQIIRGPDGAPLYAVIPWDVFEERFGATKPDEDVYLPHEVVVLHIQEGLSLIRAWREHLGLTQAEVAQRMGVSQSAFAQTEALGARPRVATLKRVAAAMGIDFEQLRD